MNAQNIADGLTMSNYEEVRSNLRTGDILFCGGNYLFSRLIRWRSCSEFSHAAILVWVHDRLLVLECHEWDGVRLVPLSSYTKNYRNKGKPYDGSLVVRRSKKIEAANLNNALCWALSKLTEQYDWDAVLKLGLGLMPDNKILRTDNRYLCSEFAGEVLHIAGGVPHSGRKYPFPETLANDCDASFRIRLQ
jgi:hypothetical protein